jgi:hypothetical protein
VVPAALLAVLVAAGAGADVAGEHAATADAASARAAAVSAAPRETHMTPILPHAPDRFRQLAQLRQVTGLDAA